MMPERRMRAWLAHAQRERAIPLSTMKNRTLCNIKEERMDRECVVVTALYNQPEAFASELDDDQSRYFY